MPTVIVYDRYIEEIDRNQGDVSVIYSVMDCHYYLKEWLRGPANQKEQDKMFIGGNCYTLAPGKHQLPSREGYTVYDGVTIRVHVNGQLEHYEHENCMPEGSSDMMPFGWMSVFLMERQPGLARFYYPPRIKCQTQGGTQARYFLRKTAMIPLSNLSERIQSSFPLAIKDIEIQ